MEKVLDSLINYVCNFEEMVVNQHRNFEETAVKPYYDFEEMVVITKRIVLSIMKLIFCLHQKQELFQLRLNHLVWEKMNL